MKKPVLLIISAVVIIAVACGVYFAVTGGEKDNTTTVSETSSVSQETESTSEIQTTETTTESTTETTSAATDKKDNLSYIYKGYWYLVDVDKDACYVFSFGKDGKVDLAQFDDTNIIGEDPQYFKGYADYKLKNNQITIEKMPKVMLIDSATIDIKDGKLFVGDEELEHHDDLKMSYAVKRVVK